MYTPRDTQTSILMHWLIFGLDLNNFQISFIVYLYMYCATRVEITFCIGNGLCNKLSNVHVAIQAHTCCIDNEAFLDVGLDDKRNVQ